MCVRSFGAPYWLLKTKHIKEQTQQRGGLGVGCGVSGFGLLIAPLFLVVGSCAAYHASAVVGGPYIENVRRGMGLFLQLNFRLHF